MVGEPDGTNNTFVVDSLAEVEAKARQVLKEKGFSDELIEAQLARVKRDYPDWPDWALEGSGADKTGERQ